MERNLNALQVLIIVAVLLGALWIQFFNHGQPCPLCFLQRIAMLGVVSGALMNCRFGPHKSHYGLSLLSAVLGGVVALRQIALHVCPDFPTFGAPFWGLSLYTWSFLVFASSVAYIGLLLLIFDQSEKEKPLNWFCQLAFLGGFLAALLNIFAALSVCGLGPCEG